MKIRPYNPDTDYQAVVALYQSPNAFGGQFDEARDSEGKLALLETTKPGSILVAEFEGRVVGSVTLFEDGRAAWLYRFAVSQSEDTGMTERVAAALWAAARAEAKQRGHTQVLVYAPADASDFEERYTQLGFTRGENYTCYWQEV